MIQYTSGPLNFNLDHCTALDISFTFSPPSEYHASVCIFTGSFHFCFCSFLISKTETSRYHLDTSMGIHYDFQLTWNTTILNCYTYSRAVPACTLPALCSGKCMILQTTYILTILMPAMLLSLVFITALYVKGKKIHQQISNLVDTPTQMTARAMKTYLF